MQHSFDHVSKLPLRWRHCKRGTLYDLLASAVLASAAPVSDMMRVVVWANRANGTLGVSERLPEHDVRLCDFATLQAQEPARPGAHLLIYRAVDDERLWARPREEFLDGRFVPVPVPTDPFVVTQRERFERRMGELGLQLHHWDPDRPDAGYSDSSQAARWEGWLECARTGLPRWISVQERMPLDGQQVWVQLVKDGRDIGQGYAVWQGDDWYLDLTESGDLYARQRAIADGLDAAEVSHWMEMPPGALEESKP